MNISGFWFDVYMIVKICNQNSFVEIANSGSLVNASKIKYTKTTNLSSK